MARPRGAVSAGIVLMLAVIAGGCEHCDAEVIESQPPHPCDVVLDNALAKCLEGCGGLNCFIIFGECLMFANDQKDECCQSMGGCSTTTSATEGLSVSQPPGPSPPAP